MTVVERRGKLLGADEHVPMRDGRDNSLLAVVIATIMLDGVISTINLHSLCYSCFFILVAVLSRERTYTLSREE